MLFAALDSSGPGAAMLSALRPIHARTTSNGRMLMFYAGACGYHMWRAAGVAHVIDAIVH